MKVVTVDDAYRRKVRAIQAVGQAAVRLCLRVITTGQSFKVATGKHTSRSNQETGFACATSLKCADTVDCNIEFTSVRFSVCFKGPANFMPFEVCYEAPFLCSLTLNCLDAKPVPVLYAKSTMRTSPSLARFQCTPLWTRLQVFACSGYCVFVIAKDRKRQVHHIKYFRKNRKPWRYCIRSNQQYILMPFNELPPATASFVRATIA